MKLDGQRILVTGGAGRVGAATVRHLLREENPAEVVVFDNLSNGSLGNLAACAADPRLRCVAGDICDTRTVRDLMEDATAVVHLAALQDIDCTREPRRGFEVLYQGSFNVVHWARHCGVQRLVAATLPGAAGPSLFDVGKQMLEGLLRAYRAMGGPSFAALRYPHVYGPHLSPRAPSSDWLMHWIEGILAGAGPCIVGDERRVVRLMHADDVARANVMALKLDGDGAVFELAGESRASLRRLARLLLTLLDPSLSPRRVDGGTAAVAADEREPADGAPPLPGFHAAIPLEEGLGELADWCRQRLERTRGPRLKLPRIAVPGPLSLAPASASAPAGS